VQVGTGLVADDEIANSGPLNRFVSGATVWPGHGLAQAWGQWILLTMVALHIGAILFYLFARGKNLVRPMVHGDKTCPRERRRPATTSRRGRWRSADRRLRSAGDLGGPARWLRVAA
jgi:cytochrome b